MAEEEGGTEHDADDFGDQTTLLITTTSSDDGGRGVVEIKD